jgi:hypothetical protein
VGCYLEGNMTSEIEAPNAVLGGILGNLGNQPPNTGMMLSHARGIAEFPNSVAAGNQKLSSSGKRVYGALGSVGVEDTALELWVDNFLQGDVYRFTYSTRKNPSTLNDPPGYLELKYNNLGGSVLSFSTSEADLPPGSLWMPAGYYVGLPTALSERVQVTTGNAPPTSGIAQKGDRVLNSDPLPGDPVRGFAGWICVAPGTPGTWKGFGLIES